MGATPITVSNAAPFRGQAVSFTANATDGDGDPLTYAWTIDGQGAGSGKTLTPAPSFTTLGSKNVAVHVTDGNGGATRRQRRA